MFVRLGLEGDEDAIVDLARLNHATSTPHLEFSEPRVRQTFRDYLTTGDTTIFVVEHNRQVAAFLLATINEFRHAAGLFCTQEVIFVHPDYRGSRAAILLMKHLVAWSRMLGAKEITGGNDNGFQSERTAKFLMHFGFQPVGYFMRMVL